MYLNIVINLYKHFFCNLITLGLAQLQRFDANAQTFLSLLRVGLH